jgi:hypothetical protein
VSSSQRSPRIDRPNTESNSTSWQRFPHVQQSDTDCAKKQTR